MAIMVKSLGRTLLQDRNEASIKVSVLVEFITGTLSNSKRLSLFWSYLPHPDSKSCTVSIVAPKLVLVISPSSEFKIMHCFFRCIPYSLSNVLTRFENLSQPDLSVGNRLSRFVEFKLKFIMGASNSEHPSLFWSYLPHPDSKSCTVSFVGSLTL